MFVFLILNLVQLRTHAYENLQKCISDHVMRCTTEIVDSQQQVDKKIQQLDEFYARLTNSSNFME